MAGQYALSRRGFVSSGTAVLAAAGLGFLVLSDFMPRIALASEESGSTSPEEQYAQVQEQIDNLGMQCEEIGLQISQTLSAMEDCLAQISRTQASIDQINSELGDLQSQIKILESGAGASDDSSAGDSTTSSSSASAIVIVPHTLESGHTVYTVEPMDSRLAELIESENAKTQQLEQDKADLEAEYAALNDLRVQQKAQLTDAQAQQDQAQELLNSLTGEVAELTGQNNAELVEQAAAAASADASGRQDASYGGVSASSVIEACQYTPSPGTGLCAGWVTNVFVNAGVGYFGGNACDMYASWCYSSDVEQLMPGMIVAVSTHSLTSAGRIYGHVGIYVGDGIVMDNIGYIRSVNFYDWTATYGTTVEPRWGWLGGVELS